MDEYWLFRFSKSSRSDRGELDLQITKSEHSNSSIVLTLTTAQFHNLARQIVNELPTAQFHNLARQIVNELPHDTSCDEDGCKWLYVGIDGRRDR